MLKEKPFWQARSLHLWGWKAAVGGKPLSQIADLMILMPCNHRIQHLAPKLDEKQSG
jgi:hypothetical protein